MASQAADQIAWDKVGGKDITLLYPAQLSWEWLNDRAEHSGAPKIAEGRTCRSCHDGKEHESGTLLVDYKPTEPAIIPGKPGALKAAVKTAHDGQTLFVQVRFDTANQPDAAQDKAFAAKVAVMIDDGGVAEAKRVGCWVACHTDANSMKAGTSAKTKYITHATADGRFLEYWQARLNPGAPAQVVNGTVAAERSERNAPAVRARAHQDGSVWTVEFSRDLASPAGLKDLSTGKTYTLGFSVHAGHTAHRFHYVSLEKTLVLDSGLADFVAARQ